MRKQIEHNMLFYWGIIDFLFIALFVWLTYTYNAPILAIYLIMKCLIRVILELCRKNILYAFGYFISIGIILATEWFIRTH